MNVLMRLFTREGRMEAQAERTEGELQARLAEIQAGITAGEGDLFALLEEREQVQRALEAARIAKEKAATEEYRAKVTAQADELRGRLHASLDELGDLVPRLILACSHFDTIAAEVQVKGLGFDAGGLLEDHFGIPQTFGRDLVAAINELAPRTAWDYGHTGPLGKGVKAERPRLKGAQALRMPRFAADFAPPPGYSGRWDPVNGRPLDD